MQSSGRTSGRVVAWLAGALAVGIVAAMVCGFVIKRESVREVGGRWKLVMAKPILASEPGWSWARLYRVTQAGRVCVAADVWAAPVYYGDDCVGYESSHSVRDRRYFFACGDRQPFLVVAARPYERWLFTATGIERVPDKEIGGEAVVTSSDVLSEESLKSRAIVQPPQASGGCD